jgi:hypothetical protein
MVSGNRVRSTCLLGFGLSRLMLLFLSHWLHHLVLGKLILHLLLHGLLCWWTLEHLQHVIISDRMTGFSLMQAALRCRSILGRRRLCHDLGLRLHYDSAALGLGAVRSIVQLMLLHIMLDVRVQHTPS